MSLILQIFEFSGRHRMPARRRADPADRSTRQISGMLAEFLGSRDGQDISASEPAHIANDWTLP
jgi:hypothetical protein